MPLLLKLRLGRFINESRNYRELSAALEAGYDVKVLAGVVSSLSEKGNVDTVKGFEVHRYVAQLPLPFSNKEHRNLIEKLIRFPIILTHKVISKFFRNFFWAKKVRSFSADVISCHNLDALIIGYISTWFMKESKKPKLVYDSHEFELGINANRSFFRAWIILRLERFLMKRSALSIMVNDSIADIVQQTHHLEIRPLVIRSTPYNWKLDSDIIKRRREEIVNKLNVPISSFIVMYHGGFTKNRGIEMLIRVVAANPNITCVILGYALDEQYMDELKSLVSEKKVTDRILFLPAVPIEYLWEYVGAVDVGTILIQNVCKNHYLSLPNKFFENIQSLTPLIASDIPEQRALINKYEIGLMCDQTSIDSINDCIEKMRTDKELYQRFKQNLITAKKDLCWENEKIALIDAYKKLAPSIPN